MRAYSRLVGWSVRHRVITLFAGLALFAASIVSTGLLPSGFIPKQDNARTLFMVELAPGAKLADTVAVSDRVVARIRALPEVTSVFVDGGRQVGGKKETRLATLTVNLTPKASRTKRQWTVEAEIAALLAEEPDIRSWTAAGQRPARPRPGGERPRRRRGHRGRRAPAA